MRMSRLTRYVMVACGVVMPITAAAQAASSAPTSPWRTPWSYAGARGPEHWGDLDPEYATCRDGKAQSPIDIRDAQPSDLPPLRFAYRSGPLRIINNGYTAVRVNYPRGNGNYLIVGDKRYELTQFHFHRPSEEMVDGKPYDMVIHLMHAASDGEIAGVAVLLRSGAPNSTVEQLWRYMPGTPSAETLIPGVQVDPSALVPPALGYFTYAGSVTAPPCTEGVKWFVLKAPLTVSPAEIAAFAKLYPHDVRPVQPLHGRVVETTHGP
jgi:carbonic anhydrase